MAHRGEEEWARRIIAVELGVPVEHHDDGSRPSMYDLRVGAAEAPDRAIEVVGAVDEIWTKTWNTGPAQGSFELDLRGDWMVSVEPGANFKELRKELQALLRELEDRDIQAAPVNSVMRFHDRPLFDRLESLGIDYVSRYQSDGTGKVSFHMMGPGGAVDGQGLAVPEWVGAFLSHPDRADVLYKLSMVDAPHREAFVAVTLEGAPWGVMSYLTGMSSRSVTLPPNPPVLPSPVSGVWIVATLSFKSEAIGVRWDGGAWSTFRSRGADIDD